MFANQYFTFLKPMSVLSIQSNVSFGYVGNSIAIPTLQSLGHDAWQINTVNFSNHPGHKYFCGEYTTRQKIDEKLRVLQKIGALTNCKAVLSGYLGKPSNATSVMRAVKLVKNINRKAPYVLDPVMGDENKLFVKPGVPAAIQNHLVSLADYLLPNLSELSWLSGKRIDDLNSLISAAHKLLQLGPSVVIVTGVQEKQIIANYAITREGVWRAHSHQFSRKFNGTGDLFSALITGFVLNGLNLADALATATLGCELVTSETHKLNSRELVLVPTISKFLAMKPTNSAKRII